MGTYDIIIIIAIGIGAVKGYLNGFIVESFSVLGFFLGLIFAMHLALPVTARFFSDSHFFDLIAIVVFIVLFVLLSMGIRFGAKVLKKMIDITIFGTLDNMAGGLLGLIKWAFLLSVFIWIFDSIGISSQEYFEKESVIYPYIKPFGPVVFGWFSEILPFIHDLMDTMEDLPRSKSTYLTYAC